jgi:hypothetical protein
MIPSFPRIELYTDDNGLARFRETALLLAEGTPQARLSVAFPAACYQFRESPVGFRSDYHCTTRPQWTIILAGAMEIGLRDGSSHIFRAGEAFFSNDLLPEGEIFNPTRHGHWSRQIGDMPLRTLFLAITA